MFSEKMQERDGSISCVKLSPIVVASVIDYRYSYLIGREVEVLKRRPTLSTKLGDGHNNQVHEFVSYTCNSSG